MATKLALLTTSLQIADNQLFPVLEQGSLFRTGKEEINFFSG